MCIWLDGFACRESVSPMPMMVTFNSRVSVRSMIYNCYLDGLQTGLDDHLTIEVRSSARTEAPQALQIRDVGAEWVSILGVNLQIRREVLCLFWQFNTFRLRPGIAETLPHLAHENIRNVFLKVITPRAGASRYAFTLRKFRSALPVFLRLPSLEIMDVCIDAPSLKACIPINNDGFCKKHVQQLGASRVIRELYHHLDENWAGYLHFRLHLTEAARLQTYEEVIRHFPSLSLVGNNSLTSCSKHELGLCDDIGYRLLHAVEEMCQTKKSSPGMRLYFFEQTVSRWTSDTSIWSPSELLPLVVDVLDLRQKQPEKSQDLRLEDPLFETMFLVKQDSPDLIMSANSSEQSDYWLPTEGVDLPRCLLFNHMVPSNTSIRFG
jgi:hypothetical protein